MLRKITRHFHTAFDRIRDPLLLVDTAGKVLSYNASAQAALALGSGHIGELKSLERAYSLDNEDILQLLGRDDSVLGRELVDDAGNRSDAVLDVIDLGAKHRGRPLKLIHIRDFSSYRNYERWKDELIAMVSHEVKNPLTAMKNSMNLLITQGAGPVTQSQQKLVTTAIRNIDRLTRMLDTFLDVSRIGSGKYIAEPEWTDTREFLGAVTSSFKTLFNVQRQDLRCDVSPEVGRLFVDSNRLEQVIINVLANATKYTPDGGEIKVVVEPAGLDALDSDLRLVSWRDIANLRFVRIRVVDNGIGMNEETLSHLFTRYYGGESSSAGTSTTGGSHLGLSISKRLVEVLGGRLTVTSSLGVGTTVTVTLPEDEHTSDVMSRLDIVDQTLSRVTMSEGASFFVLRKETDDDWEGHIANWPEPAAVNKSRVFSNSGVAVWTLGPRTAVVFYGATDGGFESVFGAPEIGRHDWTIHGDGYVIARCRVPQDGVRTVQLLRSAMSRISDRLLEDVSV